MTLPHVDPEMYKATWLVADALKFLHTGVQVTPFPVQASMPDISILNFPKLKEYITLLN